MRVLVVEDEKEIGDMIKRSLEAKCFNVDVAPDGEKALAWIRLTDYDAVILDNVLPAISGLEVCRAVRAQGKTMPLMMLSVKTDTATKVALLNAGADDYLIKPFSQDELLARLQALLRRPKEREQEIIETSDLSLNTTTYEVKRGSKPIYLTRKEFMLLFYLLRNRDTVLSRSMILEHVWDMDADPFSNTIESHIASLRRKVDLPGKKKLIHTVPGRGYKLGG